MKFVLVMQLLFLTFWFERLGSISKLKSKLVPKNRFATAFQLAFPLIQLNREITLLSAFLGPQRYDRNRELLYRVLFVVSRQTWAMLLMAIASMLPWV